MKMIYQLHIHLYGGRVASLRPCGDFSIETVTHHPRIRAIKLMDYTPQKTGMRYSLIESIDLAEVDYVEVEIVGEAEEAS